MNDPRAATNLEPTVANKHEALIAELADLIWPVIRERIASALDARINFAVENLIDDKIDDKINEYMCNNFDISDYESEIKDIVDVDDAVETHLNTYLHDEVVSCIQGLQFNVEVSSR